ncbi:MAG: DNA polymerase III subunit delta' [Rhodobacteraceae bacterium]|nr:DNA polymerase III subunit delta' [Paracoccaceae bacterium]
MSPVADLPAPDQVAGAAHPRDAARLIGQSAAEADFLEAFNRGRLHSGWLLTGPRGIGKATFAYRAAAFLLAQTDGLALGPATALGLSEDHPEMRLIRAGAHPRLAVIRRGPNDKGDKISADIRVADIRKLKKFFHMSAADGGQRVVIVDAADEMNVSAANAILKELEEPPANTTLLLVSHQPSRLLPTIRSRCRSLRFAPLSPDDMAQVLAEADVTTTAPEALAVLAAGSAGRAIAMAQNDGLEIYAALIRLFEGLPKFDRPLAQKLAEATAGRNGEARRDLTVELIGLFIARTAQAGLLGEPDRQGAPNEARLLTRLCPDTVAARIWAELQIDLASRARHALAVNLDPAALIMDMFFRIEEAAKAAAAP